VLPLDPPDDADEPDQRAGDLVADRLLALLAHRVLEAGDDVGLALVEHGGDVGGAAWPQVVLPPARERQRAAHELLEGQLGRDVRLVVGEPHLQPVGRLLRGLQRDREPGSAGVAVRLEEQVDGRVVGCGPVGHPDVRHDRRVLRVAAQLAEAEHPRREPAWRQRHAAPIPAAG
jgi:hypothetical protein